ncbi:MULTISPECIES: glycerophosphodiester phosphodiesterase family protein [Okeania]|uniref:glycerophosphodiester phosphodiesterase family protein n=1 Tax=Okeania TaxID=1458928 RepID=UPI00249DB607|nr:MULTISPECIES: glycerophosphodiester phosphodiesterase family protein [Okeania]
MAELKGFAVLPADTFAAGPPSGNFINTDNRETPFDSQPVQGFSGVQFAPGSEDGSTYWFLSDNGFGSQGNSADYLLRLYQVDPDFAGAEDGDTSVEIQDFIQLADPNNLIPFDIVNEDTSDRLLTGADFDIESFVIDNDGDIWIGDEFGPYILHFDSTGTLLEAPIATPNPIELNTLNGQDPLVIAHRGASGDLPEHTLAAYEAAIAAGADFIEPDLVTTSDGVLIARHEPLLDDTTNVSEVFGSERQSTKILDGEETTGYFAEDFTLAEIKQLRAVQSRDYRDLNFDGLFEIPTLEEVIELVQRVEAETGVQVGIYPETKHPTFFDEQNLSLEEPLIQTLQDTDFTDPDRIFIQSFEFANLIDLQGQLDDAELGDIPLVQLYGNTTEGANPEAGFSFPFDIRFNVAEGNNLVDIYGEEFIDAVEVPLSENTVYADLDSVEFLEVIGNLYAEGAGPWKNNILLRESLDTPVDADGDGEAEIRSQLTGEITSFIEDAHDAGLQVHPYTLRDEERFLTLTEDGRPQTPEAEFEQLIDIGADGFFTDFARTGVPVRDAIVADEVRAPQNPNLNDFNTLDGSAPIVIGHRGASGDFPEHTLEAYRLAIVQGADFVEPDLVITSDGVLIARHEPLLDDTTNVAEVFGPERQSTKILDGEEKTGYFAEDFTLAEIKQLRAVQSRDFRDQSFNGEFEIPTFQEVIELVQEMEGFGFEVGIYPETKHPTFFDEQGLSLEEPLIQTLQDTGFTNPNRIFIQSFEVKNLLELRNEILPAQGLENLKLVQLFGDIEDAFINEGGGGFSVPFDFVANAEEFEPSDIDAIADQVNYATFTGSAFSVTLLAEKNPGPGAPQEILDQFGNLQDTNQFILQDATNPDNTVVLFAGPDSAPKSIEVTISEAGVVAINGDEVANNFSQQVHFGLINSLPIGDPTGLGAESYTFSTNNALNPESNPQFAIYSEVENEFIIAAEELPFANSNQDFDDMIVKVTGIEPIGATQADISFNPERLQPLLETANTRAIYGNLADLIDFSSVPTYADLANAEVIELIGTYAEGLGPWKNSFLLRDDIDTPVDGDGDGNAEITTQLTGEVLPLIDWAHDAGLQVHPYTLRDEERFLTLNPDGTPQTPGEEFEQLIEIGADGFFTDFPATGSIVVEQFIDEPNIRTSRGYEGLAFSPDRETFYPLLEGAVVGDPDNALRIYEFDPESSSFTDLIGFYPTDVPGHAIGDFTPINNDEFLVIERDGRQGDAAEFKKIFKIDISVVDDEGFVEKEEVVDLLNIDDPNDLNGDGDTTFDFPFVTIEDVLVLDKDTILVANDNNYPFSIGRGPDIDNNEIIQIDLDEPLNLAPGIGVAIPTVSIDVEPETVDENGAEYSLTFNLNVPAPEGGLRVVWSETDTDNAFGDIEFPPELTNASNLEELEAVGDELARSAITIDAGATTATVTWTTIFDGEDEDDETTTIELQPEDGYVVDTENQVGQIVIQDTDPNEGQSITGTSEGDVRRGGNGDDTIIGLNGADTLVGSFGDDEIIGSRGSDSLYGQDGNDVLQGRQDNDHLFGGDGNDVLNGGQGRDRINGGAGDDTLTGGASIDLFIFNSNQEFDSDDFGVDTINNFQPDLRPDEDGNQGDRILLDKSTFTALDSSAGIGFSVDSDFEIVNNNAAVSSSDAFIVYSEASGGLFYNTSDDSTQFAILDGAPTITEDNFQIR